MAGPLRRPPAPAAAAALLLAALVLVPCGATRELLQGKVATVNVEAEEELMMKHELPDWKVEKLLLDLIRPDPGISQQTVSNLKNNYRMIYRNTISYKDVSKVCTQLQAGNAVSVRAKKKYTFETVKVLGATAACTQASAPAATPKPDGTPSPSTFQILLKKKNVPWESTFTVLRCEAASPDCYSYRLAKPCRNGRCTVEPDKTLTSGVFSDIPNPLVITKDSSPEEVIGILTDTLNAAKDKASFTKIMTTWEAYVGVAYDDRKKLAAAKAAFAKTLNRLLTKAGKKLNKSVVGLTPFSDYEPKEFVKERQVAFTDKKLEGLITGKKLGPAGGGAGSQSTAAGVSAAAVNLNFKYPDSKNWVAENKVTPIRSQGPCASCWAFATVAAVESKALIDNPKLNASQLDLSEQQLMACTPSTYDCGSGGDVDMGMSYFQKSPVVADRFFPYTSGDSMLKGACTVRTAYRRSGKAMRVVDFQVDWVYDYRDSTPGPIEYMKAYIAQYGPIVAYINLDPLQDYVGGIITTEGTGCTPDVNHAVNIVGYTPDYWIVRNSWGDDWGEDGYFRVAIEPPGTGKLPGPCGLYTVAALPTSVKWKRTA